MITSYLDESGVHDGAPACVIAGYFGGKGQWKKFDALWRKTLKDVNLSLEDFHAKKLVKSLGTYGDTLRRLAQAIAQCRKIHPVSTGVIVADFESFSLPQRRFLTGARLKGGKLVTTGSPNKPYFMPFQHCVKTVASHAEVGGRADFSFGVDRPFAGYAKELFKDIKADPIAPYRDRLGSISFPLAKETPQLQAADLLVHLTYLDLQERAANDSWHNQPSGLLATCLANAKMQDDFTYFNRECIELALQEARSLSGDWDGMTSGDEARSEQ